MTYAAAYYLGVALSVVAVGDSRVLCPKAAATLLGFCHSFEPKGEPAATCTMINRVAAPRHWNLAVQLSCDWGASNRRVLLWCVLLALASGINLAK